MEVIKRDKTIVPFDGNKIITAVSKACHSVGKIMPKEWELELIGYVNRAVGDNKHVEYIQDAIEEWLMSKKEYSVARSFIIYRDKHKNERNLKIKKKFIKDYGKAKNAATASKYDPNANVTDINIATLNAELYKYDNIMLNRSRMCDKIMELYGKDLADKYLSDLQNHYIYKHDETKLEPYCVAISMYPFLLNGLKDLGGLSAAPKNLDSFCGIFINLCFAISAQFAGALATGEFLMYFDYFARKEWGDDYPKKLHKVFYVNATGKKHTIGTEIIQKFQQIVYSMNQPAAARGFQSIFWNISYFDKFYFEGIFGDFYFPDGTKPIWETVDFIQKFFMEWFNEERKKCLLTFPVNKTAA